MLSAPHKLTVWRGGAYAYTRTRSAPVRGAPSYAQMRNGATALGGVAQGRAASASRRVSSLSRAVVAIARSVRARSPQCADRSQCAVAVQSALRVRPQCTALRYARAMGGRLPSLGTSGARGTSRLHRTRATCVRDIHLFYGPRRAPVAVPRPPGPPEPRSAAPRAAVFSVWWWRDSLTRLAVCLCGCVSPTSK